MRPRRANASNRGYSHMMSTSDLLGMSSHHTHVHAHHHFSKGGDIVMDGNHQLVNYSNYKSMKEQPYTIYLSIE
jgi:hypothetical protein